MLKRHATDQGAVGQKGDVHGRERQHRMHHIGSSRADLEQTGNTKVSVMLDNVLPLAAEACRQSSGIQGEG